MGQYFTRLDVNCFHHCNTCLCNKVYYIRLFIALDFEGKNGIEFFLVPWVGPCIHTPPPPQNQIVFIKFDKGYETSSLFAPVWVEGRLRTESLTKELFLVDGKSNINLGYAMSPKNIWGLEKK